MASTKSMKSFRSTRSFSMRSLGSIGQNDENEIVDEMKPVYELSLPNVCKRFSCPVEVVVRKEFKRDGFLKALKAEPKTKYKKISVMTPQTVSKGVSAMGHSASEYRVKPSATDYNDNTVVFTAVYDNMNHLVELNLNKISKLPRILMQCVSLLTPFYDSLYKVSITRCGIDVYTIHELNKLLRKTTASEVCLDDSPFPQANYSVLLEPPTRLRYLSISRCRVNDVVCGQLSSYLHCTQQAEKCLTVLNLASNRITDTGAKHIGAALRSNRHLRYLNLSDNQITDDGASSILDALAEFPMTEEEIFSKRRRYMTYLNNISELVKKLCKEMQSMDYVGFLEDAPKKQKKPKKTFGSPKRRLSPGKISILSSSPSIEDNREFILKKAQLKAAEEMGPFEDPFSNVVKKNEWIFSTGNFTLSYLNLSYNNLSYESVKKISKVLMYQSIHARIPETGLLKIIIDGNNMPAICPELIDIQNLLNKNLSRFAGTTKTIETRRKSKAKISIANQFPGAPSSDAATGNDFKSNADVSKKN